MIMGRAEAAYVRICSVASQRDPFPSCRCRDCLSLSLLSLLPCLPMHPAGKKDRKLRHLYPRPRDIRQKNVPVPPLVLEVVRVPRNPPNTAIITRATSTQPGGPSSEFASRKSRRRKYIVASPLIFLFFFSFSQWNFA